ncbi:Replication protein A 70 kDa DNA-binding subunit B [Raphanus sativus]|nr:Replication protein A 70 kDa DNA-binding subunit B [Raphanus sativus]
MIPKRDINLVDEAKETVLVSLWNDLATDLGQELLDMADKYPVIAIRSLNVGDFKVFRKETYMSAIVSGMMSPSANNGSRSIYSDRVCLSHSTTNPSLGEEKY